MIQWSSSLQHFSHGPKHGNVGERNEFCNLPAESRCAQKPKDSSKRSCSVSATLQQRTPRQRRPTASAGPCSQWPTPPHPVPPAGLPRRPPWPCRTPSGGCAATASPTPPACRSATRTATTAGCRWRPPPRPPLPPRHFLALFWPPNHLVMHTRRSLRSTEKCVRALASGLVQCSKKCRSRNRHRKQPAEWRGGGGAPAGGRLL